MRENDSCALVNKGEEGDNATVREDIEKPSTVRIDVATISDVTAIGRVNIFLILLINSWCYLLLLYYVTSSSLVFDA